jgi:hypothetical protein
MSAPALTVRRTPVLSELDQATAESVSTKVGWSTLISTGAPWQAMATLPRPLKTVLKRPPAAMPAPSTRRMSQFSPASKASTLSPLTVRWSSSRSTRCTSQASRARNTSPRPDTFISGSPSPVKAFLKNLLTLPDPS